MRNTVKIVLLVFLGFVASTSIFSGLAICLNPDGSSLQLDPALLRHTVFHNFLIPGLILLIIVGGSSLAGALSIVFDHSSSQLWVLAAGIIMVGWIAGQVVLIRTYHALQLVYLITGILIAGLSFFIKPVTEIYRV
jgi:hypothetical protein